MELDELKKAWIALDAVSKENKSLKESIILEMTQTKIIKSVNWLLNWEMIGAVVVLLLIPFVIYAYSMFGGTFITWDILVITCFFVCVILSFWQIYKVYILMKIDSSKEVRNNIHYMNKYKILIVREKFAVTIIIGPTLAILAILTYYQMNANSYLWTFMACMIILATVVTYWSYHKYNKNIHTILKSLNEIKELEETEEE